MTEKRYFALIGEDGYVYPVFFDSKNEDKEIDVDIVVDLLNENEQLKESVYSWSKSYNRVYEENERFKFILQEAIRTERTNIGKNVLKQLADNLGVKYE